MPRADLARLHALRRSHGAVAAAERLALVRSLGRRPPASSMGRQHWHDELLYLAAYPDDPEALAEADRHLARLAKHRPSQSRRDALVNSGLAGTPVEAAFSYDLLRWMVAKGPDPNPTWDADFRSQLDSTLLLLLLPSERDALLSEALSSRELWRLAAGTRSVPWLLDRLAAVAPDPEVRDRLLEDAKLTVRWPLSQTSRTLTRFPPRPLFPQSTPLLRHVSLGPILRQPLPAATRPPTGDAHELIDIARATLTARARETDTVTWANPEEVELVQLDRGIDVMLLGLAPARRLPVESYFGFVAARNRVPIAYGGGWVFFNRCEIGVNLFPEFRGGESAVIFSQVLRAYHQRYRVRQFLVDPYQFGRGNNEAIQSGAYWFYHRLGFRSTDPAVAREAATAWRALEKNPKQPTAPEVLRRFTDAPLFLDVSAVRAGRTPALTAPWRPVAPDLPALNLALTQWIARECGADRRRALLASRQRLDDVLGAKARPRTAAARHWFNRLAPLVAMIPNLGDWPRAERQQVAAALAAKGGMRERDYALSLQQLPRLRRAWARLAARAAASPTGA